MVSNNIRRGAISEQIAPIVKANVARETAMMADTGAEFLTSMGEFASHDMVNHGEKEYVRPLCALTSLGTWAYRKI
jgi:hypothetical protein